MIEPPTTVVATDANLLINLIHVGRLLLLGQLPNHQFVVPEAVVAEVTDEQQRAQLIAAIATGALSIYELTDLRALALFTDLRPIMGAGEAACLALAQPKGWSVGSDEKKRFRREVIVRLGEDRLLTTPTIYVLAIQAGLLTVADADADKELLAERRFRMTFKSFSELIDPSTG